MDDTRTSTRTPTARRAGLVAAGTALGLALSGLPAATAQEVRTPRLAGESRFETAVQIAAERTADGQQSIETVLLARADDFPDALAGAGLASAVEGVRDVSAPILLTDRETLPTATSRALERFSVRRVVLLGGTDAISQGVQDQLAQDYEVTRVPGADRYATAAAAARRLVANAGGLGSVDGRTTVLLASGREFADALAGGPLAYAAQLPILLTARDALPAATAGVLDELDPEQVLVLGGEAAVSSAVQSEVQRRGISTRRLGGADRQATAARIADFAVSEAGFDGQGAVLARGDAFPDALAGAPQAGRTRAPILLTQTPTALGAPTRDWLVDRSDTVGVVQVLGGTRAVSPSTVAQAEQAAGSTGGGGGGGDGGGGQEPFPADRSPDTATASSDARLNVVDMRFGRHAGYDRVVLEMAGTGSPGWRVEYVEDPRRQGTGNRVELRGSAALKADITGVIYPTAPDGQPYRGPEEIFPESPGVVLEADMGTSYEGHRQAFFGLSSREAFRVFSLQNPTRIVIDVQHPTGGTSDQDFGVAPQEALTSSVGSMQQFRVFSRFDGPFTGPVGLALFPCENVAATGAGPVVFTDADGDGHADRIGQSDTGAARIIGVGGQETNATTVRGVSPSDGMLGFHVNAAAADCTVPVVHDDEDGDSQLDVDGQGRGTEPFGVGQIRWQ